ncbi:hypothetical protein [Mycolicibacterium sp. PDY-3]|uniref:hypothetical protein n=1 Tax=Mycolicibacterium sp. PDY-3 TaxID=3376069 RepID=UPI003788F7C2
MRTIDSDPTYIGVELFSRPKNAASDADNLVTIATRTPLLDVTATVAAQRISAHRGCSPGTTIYCAVVCAPRGIINMPVPSSNCRIRSCPLEYV